MYRSLYDGLKEIALAINSSNQNVIWIDWIQAVGILIAALVGIFSIKQVHKQLKTDREVLVEGKNQRERENISNILNNFFGPIISLRSESKTIYQHFALKEKEDAKAIGQKRFRTLRHLANEKSFTPQDRILLDEILQISDKQLQIIEKEGYLISNSQMATLFGKLGAHIRVLKLASDYKLNGMSDLLEDLVFPKEVDGAIESEVRRLRDRYNELFEHKKKVEKARPNRISKYYNDNALSYFHDTSNIDMKNIQDWFLNYIPFGGLIFDAGCGVGRDTRKFIQEGYRVISSDISEKMVEYCNSYSFAYCQKEDLREIQYTEEFDGIWACASLVHFNEPDLMKVLYNLKKALVSGGYLYASLKKRVQNKNNIKIKEGIYYYYDETFLRNILENIYQMEVIKFREEETKKENDNSIWLSFICRKE